MATDYGREMMCFDSLKTGRFVTGPALVAQACYGRLTTPRGMLRGGEAEDNYGLDLTELVGGTNTKSLEASFPGRIVAELEKDERIESESITVDVLALRSTDGTVSFQITINAVTGAGPFELQLLASAVTVELLGVTTA